MVEHKFEPNFLFLAEAIQTVVSPRRAFKKAQNSATRQFEEAFGGIPTLQRELRPTSLFVWIPKTAGTSLFNWVNSQIPASLLNEAPRIMIQCQTGEEPGFTSFGHYNVDDLVNRGVLDENYLRKIPTFAFVRNPFDRAISLFRYSVKMGAVPRGIPFAFFLNLILRQEPRPGLYDWAGLSQGAPAVSWCRQDKWTGPRTIYRIEEFDASLSQLSGSLGLTGRPGWENRTASPDGARLRISEREARLVHRIYEEDFAAFGYSRDPNDSMLAVLRPRT